MLILARSMGAGPNHHKHPNSPHLRQSFEKPEMASVTRTSATDIFSTQNAFLASIPRRLLLAGDSKSIAAVINQPPQTMLQTFHPY